MELGAYLMNIQWEKCVLELFHMEYNIYINISVGTKTEQDFERKLEIVPTDGASKNSQAWFYSVVGQHKYV